MEIKKEIIIVEDDNFQEKIFRKIISEISSDKDFFIVSFSRGAAAVEYIKENCQKVGLVVMDLALPDLSGLEAIKNIKKIRSEIDIIALTATEDKDIVVEAIKLGAKDYFVKGKNKEELERFFVSISNSLQKD